MAQQMLIMIVVLLVPCLIGCTNVMAAQLQRNKPELTIFGMPVVSIPASIGREEAARLSGSTLEVARSPFEPVTLAPVPFGMPSMATSTSSDSPSEYATQSSQGEERHDQSTIGTATAQTEENSSFESTRLVQSEKSTESTEVVTKTTTSEPQSEPSMTTLSTSTSPIPNDDAPPAETTSFDDSAERDKTSSETTTTSTTTTSPSETNETSTEEPSGEPQTSNSTTTTAKPEELTTHESTPTVPNNPADDDAVRTGSSTPTENNESNGSGDTTTPATTPIVITSESSDSSEPIYKESSSTTEASIVTKTEEPIVTRITEISAVTASTEAPIVKSTEEQTPTKSTEAPIVAASTEAPIVTSTEESAPTASTEAPIVTSTEESVPTSSTEAPSVTASTEAPIVTSTEESAPISSTEAPTASTERSIVSTSDETPFVATSIDTTTTTEVSTTTTEASTTTTEQPQESTTGTADEPVKSGEVPRTTSSIESSSTDQPSSTVAATSTSSTVEATTTTTTTTTTQAPTITPASIPKMTTTTTEAPSKSIFDECNFLPTYDVDEVQKVFREETTYRNGTIKGKFTYISYDQRYRMVHYTRLPYGPVKIDKVDELGKPNNRGAAGASQATPVSSLGARNEPPIVAPFGPTSFTSSWPKPAILGAEQPQQPLGQQPSQFQQQQIPPNGPPFIALYFSPETTVFSLQSADSNTANDNSGNSNNNIFPGNPTLLHIPSAYTSARSFAHPTSQNVTSHYHSHLVHYAQTGLANMFVANKNFNERSAKGITKQLNIENIEQHKTIPTATKAAPVETTHRSAHLPSAPVFHGSYVLRHGQPTSTFEQRFSTPIPHHHHTNLPHYHQHYQYYSHGIAPFGQLMPMTQSYYTSPAHVNHQYLAQQNVPFVLAMNDGLQPRARLLQVKTSKALQHHARAANIVEAPVAHRQEKAKQVTSSKESNSSPGHVSSVSHHDQPKSSSYSQRNKARQSQPIVIQTLARQRGHTNRNGAAAHAIAVDQS